MTPETTAEPEAKPAIDETAIAAYLRMRVEQHNATHPTLRVDSLAIVSWRDECVYCSPRSGVTFYGATVDGALAKVTIPNPRIAELRAEAERLNQEADKLEALAT